MNRQEKAREQIQGELDDPHDEDFIRFEDEDLGLDQNDISGRNAKRAKGVPRMTRTHH